MRLPLSVRQFLCALFGHRWHQWGTYSGGTYPIFGAGEIVRVHGENWGCRRCGETERRNEVETRERVEPRFIQWSEQPDRDAWETDPDSWKS